MIVDAVLLLSALFLLPPAAMLFLECAAAWWGAPRQIMSREQPPHVAVLIPAHDEALGIAAMLQALLPELSLDVRAIVIADNCSDATAEIARRLGVAVLERRDPQHIGKSHALAYGIDSLAADPPDVVIVLDADCLVAPGAVDRLARVAHASRRPVQAAYLLETPPNARPEQMLSAFAVRVRNLVRPAGLARMGLPCFLNGSGMAFPWEVIRSVPLGSGKLVEDRWLTIELACRNDLVLLDVDARLFGRLPTSKPGARMQRTRWEHGHLEAILHGAPRLAGAAWQNKRWALFWLMLDLIVPPVSLLIAAWGGVFVLNLGARGLGFSSAPLDLSVVDGLVLAAAILSAWWKYGRGEFPLATLCAAPGYILSKLPLYLAFLTRRQTVWERSERDSRAPHLE